MFSIARNPLSCNSVKLDQLQKKPVTCGQIRLVSAEAFAKYPAKHPEMKEPPPAVPDRFQPGTSRATPKRLYFIGGIWAGHCEQ